MNNFKNALSTIGNKLTLFPNSENHTSVSMELGLHASTMYMCVCVLVLTPSTLHKELGAGVQHYLPLIKLKIT